jgi:hypothetical protein
MSMTLTTKNQPKGRKKGDVLARLSPRERKYVQGRAEGKTKKDAAIAAGYSPATARNAAVKVERADVRLA